MSKVIEKRWPLRDLLALRRMTEAELARQLGMSRATVNLWVHGKSIPSLATLDRLCTILDVRRDDIEFGPPKEQE